MLLRPILFRCLVVFCALFEGPRVAATAVWIDSDPAIGSPIRDVDDGFALMLAFHSPELRIVGISTSYGNGSLATSTRVAKEMTQKFGRSVVRPAHVHSGARSARDLGRETTATTALVRAIRNERDLTYIALGPLTNLATLELRHSKMARQINRIVVIGGKSPEASPGFGPTRSFRIHDANIHKDPEAAAVLLRSSAPLLLIPVETSGNFVLGPRQMRALARGGPRGDFLFRRSRIWFWFWTGLIRNEGAPLFDPLAVVAAARPQLLRMEERFAVVNERRELIAHKFPIRGSRPVRFCTAFEPRAKALVLERLGTR